MRAEEQVEHIRAGQTITEAGKHTRQEVKQDMTQENNRHYKVKQETEALNHTQRWNQKNPNRTQKEHGQHIIMKQMTWEPTGNEYTK